MHELLYLLPELTLFLGALAILMTDVFFAKKIKDWSSVALLSAIGIGFLSLYSSFLIYFNQAGGVFFSDAFASNKFTCVIKMVIQILLLCILLISHDFNKSEKKVGSEFLVLMMIATVGSMSLISSNDLLTFYLSLELQTLPLYILAAMKRNSNKSTEAGMKYFLLGSTSSAIILLGISLIFGFSGSLNIEHLIERFYTINFMVENHQLLLGNPQAIFIGANLGFVLLIVGILFKVSAAPFHMWSPDVYEGSPTVITAFFTTVIKFTMIIVMTIMFIYMTQFISGFKNIIVVVSILSLLVGCFGALKQSNIKRMLAYSGIGHVGFILAGLCAGGNSYHAIKASIIYAVIYATLSIGVFCVLLSLSSKNKEQNEDKNNDEIYKISSLAGIAKTNPIFSLCLAILMLSMAGIPPLAGFFSKFYILYAILAEKHYFLLAITAVMTSVISTAYYLRIIKIMYFDDKNHNIEIKSNPAISSVLVLATLFNLLFLAFSSNLVKMVVNILMG